DDVIAAFDLDGKINSKGWIQAYDSIFHKQPSQIAERLNAMKIIAEKNLASASKDISGPGIIGTVAMLCESSKVGAEINLESIPRPANVKLKDWLITYPSIGFILTSSKADSCIKIFKEHKLRAARIGKIIKDKKIRLKHRKESAIFIDLNKESIFGKRKTL
ncbi:MAG: AIR synthase-related protein, partial [Candidatus Bathyarchaeia archaeon]